MPKNTTEQTKKMRNRNYAAIVYPDSAPADWVQILENLHIPALVSPIHDRDVAPDGKLKKAHYHVLIMFQSLKSRQQAEECFKAIGGVGIESVYSLPSHAQYLIHRNNSNKAQYDAADVIALSGANYAAVANIAADDTSILCDIFEFIRINQITSFARFIDFCTKNKKEWLKALTSNRTFLITHYIRSLGWELNNSSHFKPRNKRYPTPKGRNYR